MNGQVLLDVRGISKSFPGVQALREVELEVRRGEVHALCGENGAGKSTLMYVLAGAQRPDSGSIWFDGRENVRMSDEHAAQQLGISMVYQERNLVGSLSIAENMFAGRQPTGRCGSINFRSLWARTAGVLAELDLRLDSRAPVEGLSPAQQQMIEIGRALSLNAKLLILDEPTSSLTQREVSTLFRVLNGLKQQGTGIIYISHRLEEIFQVADRVTVLRDGEYRGTFLVPEVSPGVLIAAMAGRDVVPAAQPAERPRSERATATLEVRNIRVRDRVRGASFAVRAGEILGIAGLAGAGRTELAMAVFGAIPRQSGEILIEGRRVEINSPRQAIRVGLGYVPEERRADGLFLELSVIENIVAAQLNRFGRWWQRSRSMASVARDCQRRFRIQTREADQAVACLSGGNQQKAVLARWLLANPKILIVDEPTRGIDVGAKAEVHNLLRNLAAQGTAIVLISSELPEILAVSGRILVMREGVFSGEMEARHATEEEILRYATAN